MPPTMLHNLGSVSFDIMYPICLFPVGQPTRFYTVEPTSVFLLSGTLTGVPPTSRIHVLLGPLCMSLSCTGILSVGGVEKKTQNSCVI